MQYRSATDSATSSHTASPQRAAPPTAADEPATLGESRSRRPRLSKTRYVAGLKCPKLLWWMTHEREALELVPSPELQAIFDRGHAVGALARGYRPGGVLIDLPHERVEARVEATERALASGSPVLYEASFLQDGIFVAVDILERSRRGWVVTEVKATLDLKPEHIPDLAVQTHVVEAAGLKIVRAEVMHLNRECVAPDLTNLFATTDVTPEVRMAALAVPDTAAEQQEVLAGPVPQVEPGEQCDVPHRCPFYDRCHPARREHHVSTLYRIGAKKASRLAAEGVDTVDRVPSNSLVRGPQLRQIESVRSGRVIVEAGLGEVLAELEQPIAFVDFETIRPPVPVWPGCRPYQGVSVQLSCHVLEGESLVHHAWLSEGDADPREPFARALLAACGGAKTLVAYHVSFERAELRKLAAAVPALGAELEALAERLDDLLPLVRDNVYHPKFGGSFSLKAVAPALAPHLSYESLPIATGRRASLELERHLLAGDVEPAERAEKRKALLDYCHMDTLSMVEVYKSLLTLCR